MAELSEDKKKTALDPLCASIAQEYRKQLALASMSLQQCISSESEVDADTESLRDLNAVSPCSQRPPFAPSLRSFFVSLLLCESAGGG